MGNLHRLKKCKRCGVVKPLDQFHLARPGQPSPRCKACHGLADRTCAVCGRAFIGLAAKILCSEKCRLIYRPQTFRDCAHCGKRFGPLSHLTRKYCCYQCKAAAMVKPEHIRWVATEEARQAHLQVRYAIRRGDLVRPVQCEKCGKKCKPEGAHSDYSQPLKVRWLCRRCHVLWDQKEPKGGAIATHHFRKPISGRNGARDGKKPALRKGGDARLPAKERSAAGEPPAI